MAVNYTRTNWKNRIVQRPRTYNEVNNADGSRTDSPAPGTIVQAGTPLNETNLNNMDAGIAACAANINQNETRIGTLETDLASTNTRVANNERAITAVQAVNETQSRDITTLRADLIAVNAELESHEARRDNPHQVTKAQVGLGNVPNVTTNNQKPTWTEAGTNAVPVSNTDTLSTALGKIVRAVRLFYEHLTNTDNPHAVTKTQVGLSNVPNVTTNNQRPTWTEAGANTGLSSNETLSTAFGKIARAVRLFYEHLADLDNPHNTGLMDTAKVTLLSSWGEPDAIGTFTGNGSNAATLTVNGVSVRGQQINLGFAPSKVAIIIPNVNAQLGMDEIEASGMRGIGTLLLGQSVWGVAVFAPGRNYYHSTCPNSSVTDPPETVLGRHHGGAVVYGTSFIVQSYDNQDSDTVMNMNVKNRKYTYLAWR